MAAVPNRPSPVYRHSLPIRVTHWLNLAFLIAMLGSGLQIFNAHPALYWGERSDPERAWLTMRAITDPETGERRGITSLWGYRFGTTGLFGLSNHQARGFPSWATIPSDQWLALGRRWHLFFAWLFIVNGLVYLSYSIVSRHFRRDLWPHGADVRALPSTFRHHLSLHALRADSERGYNPLQKISYVIVVLGFAPLMLITGLAMSPWIDAAYPGLVMLFDGRQSARSIHFLTAFGLVLFTAVHIIMVIAVGPVRHVRAMITGWFSSRKPEA